MERSLGSFCAASQFLLLALNGRADRTGVMSAVGGQSGRIVDAPLLPLMTQCGHARAACSRVRYLAATHHIAGASTARRTIGIHMNHAAPAYSPLTTL